MGTEIDGDDLVIGKRTRGCAGAGTWVFGTVAGHAFEALVFPEHAAVKEYELQGDSRISKLWLKRVADNRVVFAWDRGPGTAAADAEAEAVVAFLCAGMAEHVYGE